MHPISMPRGLSTLVNHEIEEQEVPLAHVLPIFQTSAYTFPDYSTAAATFRGEIPGYTYTRGTNPNVRQLAKKLAVLEGLDLLRESPAGAVDDLVAGELFASGMAAISAALLARAKSGDTLIAQRAIYGGTYGFLDEIAPRLGLEVVWVDDLSAGGWEAAFQAHPRAALAFVETPANPSMKLVDIQMVSQIAARYGSWVYVDNTFATPYCTRPLALGADVVLHSTTKYLSGHGTVIGGAVVSKHIEYVREDVHRHLRLLGGSPSPFDAWLTDLGLRTFELRMERHCHNALALAEFLLGHPAVQSVHYPGLESHPDHSLARRQMQAFGGMLSFELKGGLAAVESLLDRVVLVTFTASLGNVDTLIAHPAVMSHRDLPLEVRRTVGVPDNLVRLSVGIENVEDLMADLDAALRG